MTKRYQITNVTSGVDLGVYDADTPELALDAMARDANYRDYAHAQSVAPAAEGEIVVEEVAED